MCLNQLMKHTSNAMSDVFPHTDFTNMIDLLVNNTHSYFEGLVTVLASLVFDGAPTVKSELYSLFLPYWAAPGDVALVL